MVPHHPTYSVSRGKGGTDDGRTILVPGVPFLKSQRVPDPGGSRFFVRLEEGEIRPEWVQVD